MRIAPREALKRLAFFSLFLLGTYGYLFTNRLNDRRGLVPVVVDTPLDALIPLVPVFVIPYLLWSVYVLAACVVLFLDPSDRFYRFVLSVFLGMVAATAVFYFFPTYMQRPEPTQRGFLYDVLRWIYSVDRPFNSLPSTHVFYSVLVFWNLFKWKPRALAFQAASLAFCLLVCASTVLIKQHNTPDVPTGLALALAVSLPLEIPKEGFPWRRSRSMPGSADSTRR
jgi:membrane-associated phospholipid phosphatase